MATGTGASLYVTGAPTAMSGPVAMSLVSGTTYRINTAAMEIFDPAAALTFYDGGLPISASGITDVNMLHGEVTLSSTGTITVDGNYLPRTQVATCTDLEIALAKALASDTPIGQAGYTRTGTLLDVSGSMLLTDPDGGTTVGGGDALADLLRDGTSFVVEINRGSGDLWRARVKFESRASEIDREALAKTRLAFALDSVISVEGYEMGFARG